MADSPSSTLIVDVSLICSKDQKKPHRELRPACAQLLAHYIAAKDLTTQPPVQAAPSMAAGLLAPKQRRPNSVSIQPCADINSMASCWLPHSLNAISHVSGDRQEGLPTLNLLINSGRAITRKPSGLPGVRYAPLKEDFIVSFQTQDRRIRTRDRSYEMDTLHRIRHVETCVADLGPLPHCSCDRDAGGVVINALCKAVRIILALAELSAATRCRNL
jgi:hypothetical protein